MTTLAAFDWPGLHRTLLSEIADTVAEYRAEQDDEIYGVAVYGFYADGESIAWPMIGVSGSASDAADDEDLRWHPYDWEFSRESSEIGEQAAEALTAYAADGSEEHFDGCEERFLQTVVDACRQAREELTAAGALPRAALVIAADEGEELIPQCVSPAELAEHFPHLNAEQEERDRVAALPRDERIAALLDAIEHDDGPLDWESAPPLLLEIAADEPDVVIDAALHRLLVAPGRGFPSSHRWISLLSDIGSPRPDVIEALTAIAFDSRAEQPRSWAASTLCRLGRIDVVGARYAELAADLRSCFAEGYKRPLAGVPLDFAPLEAVLAEHPELDEVLLDELNLNHTVAATEVPGYFAALGSPWPSIRRHAVWSLIFAELGSADRDRLRAALDVLADDPHPALSSRVPELQAILDRGGRD